MFVSKAKADQEMLFTLSWVCWSYLQTLVSQVQTFACFIAMKQSNFGPWQAYFSALALDSDEGKKQFCNTNAFNVIKLLSIVTVTD
jgi:hypothetical protein